MRIEHKISNLSITVISLISIFFHFLFPSTAFAAGINKKNVLSFNFSAAAKPYSIALADTNNKKTIIIATKSEKVNYPVSTIVIADTKKTVSTPVVRAKKTADSTPHEEFTEYIAKDRYIDPEKDAELAAGNLKVVSTKRVLVTAYSSTADQTDSSPFITAANTHVHDGIIASNFLPFGTKVRMPSLYPNKIFTVEDRMKSNVKVDIWFSSRQEALNFGARVVEIEIVENI